MPLDYNDAKRVFYNKLGEKIDRHGGMDAALLTAFEFVYKAGLDDGMRYAVELDKNTLPFVDK